MGTADHRQIDWQIARLHGGLFPRSERDASEPLIEVSATSSSPAQDEALPPPIAATPRPPRRAGRLTTAALAGGVLITTSLCAMAFQASLTGPARIARARPPAAFVATAMPEVAPLVATTPHEDAIAAATPHAEEVDAVTALPDPVATPAPRRPRAPAAAGPIISSMTLPAGAQVLHNELATLGAPVADIDSSGAALAMALAGRRAAGCLQPEDPRVSMPVSVTFAPSGHVTSARLDGGPFLGTPAGSCIALALRAATVREFQGGPVTLHGSIHIH